jgi:hypothetical protein
MKNYYSIRDLIVFDEALIVLCPERPELNLLIEVYAQSFCFKHSRVAATTCGVFIVVRTFNMMRSTGSLGKSTGAI